jgi:hypothetical protein
MKKLLTSKSRVVYHSLAQEYGPRRKREKNSRNVSPMTHGLWLSRAIFENSAHFRRGSKPSRHGVFLLGRREVLSVEGSKRRGPLRKQSRVHPRNALTLAGCADKRTAERQAAEVGERPLRFSSRDKAGTSTGGSQTWRINAKSPGLCQDDALLTDNEATDRPRVGRCCQDSPPGYSRVGDFLTLAPSLP